jgi:DNA-binding transcriptional LysR family regulator
MNLHALRVFHAIAQTGSVTRASETLQISQPAVTIQLRNLEKELNLQLTVAQGRGIALTDSGRWLAEQAHRLFALESDIASALIDYRNGKAGTLRLAATYVPVNYLLPPFMAQFKHRHPAVGLEAHTSNAQHAIHQLLHYEVEMAFVGGMAQPPQGIESRLVMEDEMWFIAPKDHPLARRPVSLAELVRAPFVLREPGSSTRDILMSLCREKQVPVPAAGIQMNGPNETVRAVMAGFGIVFASSLEVSEYVRRDQVAKLEVADVHPTNAVTCCTREKDPLSPQAQAFLDMLKDGLEKEASRSSRLN